MLMAALLLLSFGASAAGFQRVYFGTETCGPGSACEAYTIHLKGKLEGVSGVPETFVEDEFGRAQVLIETLANRQQKLWGRPSRRLGTHFGNSPWLQGAGRAASVPVSVGYGSGSLAHSC